ncbi:lipoprotein-releasing ABC transporter ATP-binding protein LolD [Advenella mimigardefordensis]|uniref:Lipoprotein-releasing system ATP-binding protein LolD n=1 Tax=Advenella mimigardefordensis (strain DSM 17166 / LMG 22922 / DPN7) TaxID=1247726 RepID=W0PF84_ADVMD|nr:lipoprotein-releasing ABC transporter ATP-binding protein LolD [Advenella mimigardefordensis]AHG63955.1 lipoprotein-releasing system ATP-binding protein LolD [Advenella mimigardefordensis DPN7]
MIKPDNISIQQSTYALESRDVVKYYDDGNARLDILKGVSLQVSAGEMVAIIGASGSGKSTLLHMLGLLDKPTSGQILINGQQTHALSEKAISHIRNESLGFVYQFHHLLNEFNALDNVAMPLIVRRMDRKQARSQAEAVLERVGLKERIHHTPGQLSGGERQRVALARALVTRPVCVLADEPTGNLDRETAASMFALLKQMNAEFKTAFVIVTHDAKLAALADRQLVMERGVLQAA